MYNLKNTLRKYKIFILLLHLLAIFTGLLIGQLCLILISLFVK